MEKTKDRLLYNICLLETYKEIFEDYGYTKERVDEFMDILDKELSLIYRVMCDEKWDFEDSDYKKEK